MSVSKKCNKKDRSLCLFRRYNGVDSLHLCLYWHYSRASCHQFTVHLLQQEASVFKVTLGKNLIFSRKKASSV